MNIQDDYQQEDQNDWIFDAIYAFFQSARWQTPVQGFIETKCILFLGVDTKSPSEDHLKIHKQFTSMIDGLMQVLLTDIGINQKQFLGACQGAKNNKHQWKIVKQILLVDNFKEFCKIMLKRNDELEKKALSLMLQNEQRSLSKYMVDQGMVARDPVQEQKDKIKGIMKGQMNQQTNKGVDNSFESEYESEEEDDGLDEGMRMAIKLSKEQEKIDKMKSKSSMGNENSEYEQALAMSMQDAGGTEEGPSDNFNAMMMDTKGFNMFLKQSENEAKLEDQKRAAKMESEEAQLNAAIQLSKQATQMEQQKLSEDEMQIKLAIEKSQQQALHEEELRKKNEELLNLMKAIEDQKPADGWGFKKKLTSVDDQKQDQFDGFQDNLEQAIKKLEIKDKIKGSAAPNSNNGPEEQEPKISTEQILKESKIDDSETLESRQARLLEHKNKLIEARNAERKEELMRTSFFGVMQDEKSVNIELEAEQKKQKVKFEAQMAMRASRKGALPKKEDSDDQTDEQGGVIDDNYNIGEITNLKQVNIQEPPKVLDDDFMAAFGELKAAAVPDSDDECYF